MTLLVDTNVLSELVRPRPDPGVLTWAQRVPTWALSLVSVEEMLFGLFARPNPRIQAWVETCASELCEVLPVTPEIASLSGQMRGMFAARGKLRTQADMLIAATAHAHRLTLVTRNTRDFEGCGIALLNPFTGTAPAR